MKYNKFLLDIHGAPGPLLQGYDGFRRDVGQAMEQVHRHQQLGFAEERWVG